MKPAAASPDGHVLAAHYEALRRDAVDSGSDSAGKQYRASVTKAVTAKSFRSSATSARVDELGEL